MGPERITFGGRLLPAALIAPQLLIVGLFFYWPAVQAVWQSFQMQDAFGLSTEFVWFENYRALFTDPAYYQALVTTLVFGTKKAGSALRTGQTTVEYIPGASVCSLLMTSSSTGMDRVLASSAGGIRATVPENVRVGKAGTLNETLVPRTIPPTFSSGTATTSRSRETC